MGLHAERNGSALPPLASDFGGDASLARFGEMLAGIGGTLVRLAARTELAATVQQLFPEARRIASSLLPPSTRSTPADVLADVDLAVLAGEFGVAENGAV